MCVCVISYYTQLHIFSKVSFDVDRSVLTNLMLCFLDRVDQCVSSGATSSCCVLQCVAVCCSVLQGVAVCCSSVRCSILTHLMLRVLDCIDQQISSGATSRCSVLQCVAVQCAAVCCSSVCCSVSQAILCFLDRMN